jgi:hypothetical protein
MRQAPKQGTILGFSPRNWKGGASHAAKKPVGTFILRISSAMRIGGLSAGATDGESRIAWKALRARSSACDQEHLDN